MKVVDLDQELSTLFRGEEMLAFFDFTIPVDGGDPCPGLCRISRPRARSSGSTYFSVLFMIDTPAGERRDRLDEVLRDADWERCAERLPVKAEALPMPGTEASGDAYVLEIDFVLGAGPQVTEERLCRDVVAALRATLGIDAGEVTPWRADAAEAAPSAPQPAPASAWQRALDRVRGRKS